MSTNKTPKLSERDAAILRDLHRSRNISADQVRAISDRQDDDNTRRR